MPRIYGQQLSRREYLARVGDVDQCFGIRAVQYASGKAAMIRAYEVDPASGLTFSVSESKGLDLFELSYRGVRFSFVTKAGYSSPWITEEQGMAYRNNLGAGFLYTAGLSNVGGPVEDGGFYRIVHGNLTTPPARNVCWKSEWDGDECALSISGDVRDSAFFGRNLLLHRELRVNVGEKRFFIRDTIENQGFDDEQIMLLYHMNLGYPVLDADTMLLAPVVKEEPLSEHTRTNDRDYARMIAPIDNNVEYLHALTLATDADNRTACAAYNERLGLGLYIRYNADWLKYLIEWKCMSSGDYALGMLPSTCRPSGREANRADGDLRRLAPFEQFENLLEIGVIEGSAERDAYLASIRDLR